MWVTVRDFHNSFDICMMLDLIKIIREGVRHGGARTKPSSGSPVSF
jgi:hypothetical protein